MEAICEGRKCFFLHIAFSFFGIIWGDNNMALLTADNLRRLHRDAQCAADVKQMEELGKFPVEFRVYGTASQARDGEILYRAGENEDKLYDYMQEARLRDVMFTPILTDVVYEKVSSDQQAQKMYETKYGLIKKMKLHYEGCNFFDLMKPLFDTSSNNNGYEVIEAFQKEIDGYFEDAFMQLFIGMVDMAFDAKILTIESYRYFKAWYDDVYRQMEDMPVVEELYKRTFYGFVYHNNSGAPKVFCDARRMTVVHKREELILKGYLVGSIVKKRYSFSEMSALSGARNAFRMWLLELEDSIYFDRLHVLKRQVGVIDEIKIQEVKDSVENDVDAYRAVCYYEKLWNKTVGGEA